MKKFLCTQNRELSWLKFNERVLEEANDEKTPIFERLKFLSIFISNLDEFFMIRVGSLYDLALIGEETPDNKSGMTPLAQLNAIFEAALPLYRQKDEAYFRILERLQVLEIGRVTMDTLTAAERKHVERHFKSSVLPLLSPQIIDNRHPFPHLDNKQLNIAMNLARKDKSFFGIIPVTSALPRCVFLPGETPRYVLVEDVILAYAETLFDTYRATEKCVICVTRNADINVDEGLADDDDMDYRQHVKRILKKRARLNPVRLEIQGTLSPHLKNYLCDRLNISGKQVFQSGSPLSLPHIFALEGKIPEHMRETVLNPPFTPRQPVAIHPGESVMRQVLRKDLLLSYPYESMKPFIKLIKEAANDSAVVSIKITLYRMDRDSKIARHLIEAVENGKEVTVLLELRARFDEQNNIDWAHILEEAGCRVIYGLDGFKVHSKVCLITRRERSRLTYITQIGTGNYNEKTAKLYTDLSLITADPEIGNDAVEFFKNMCIGNLSGTYRHLLVAPNALKAGIIENIDQEIESAAKGTGGLILMKMNSLTDKDIIDKLIAASQVGVKIQLIIRGVCCLIPQIKGYTDHITVISIVGRFLEHPRVFSFGEGEHNRLYIGSADMMTRNTERRVEVLVPIYSEVIRARIRHMLTIMLSDNVKAREMQSDGTYVLRRPESGNPLNSQVYFMHEYIAKSSSLTTSSKKRGRLKKWFLQHFSKIDRKS